MITSLLQANQLRIYYGEDDGWCPLAYRDNVLKVRMLVFVADPDPAFRLLADPDPAFSKTVQSWAHATTVATI